MADFLQQAFEYATAALPSAISVASQASGYFKTVVQPAAETAASKGGEFASDYFKTVVHPFAESAVNKGGEFASDYFKNPLQPIIEPVLSQVNGVSLMAWEEARSSSSASTFLETIRQLIISLLTPVVDLIIQHPWVLLPLLVPALKAWIFLLGFQSGGIAAGSIAAAIQSMIGSVPAGSIFAFLQSYGAGGWAAAVVNAGGHALLIAFLLIVIGTLLKERGMAEDIVTDALEQVWNDIFGTQIRLKDEL
ncbi:hypothetical protein BDD12DRAFT_431483 [Trichophaea hybrida]|nr:hypothetical protein BDD12DRAFT_431483 [Trichophaea hybrida]